MIRWLLDLLLGLLLLFLLLLEVAVIQSAEVQVVGSSGTKQEAKSGSQFPSPPKVLM